MRVSEVRSVSPYCPTDRHYSSDLVRAEFSSEGKNKSRRDGEGINTKKSGRSVGGRYAHSIQRSDRRTDLINQKKASSGLAPIRTRSFVLTPHQITRFLQISFFTKFLNKCRVSTASGLSLNMDRTIPNHRRVNLLQFQGSLQRSMVYQSIFTSSIHLLPSRRQRCSSPYVPSFQNLFPHS